MSEDRPWDLYVRDMLEACGRVSEFTDAMDQAGFVADVRCDPAQPRAHRRGGHPHPRVGDSHPDPLAQIVGARNVIMHQYLGTV